jgi:Ran GTPase-activating protein (RanGAP) involved in mRNA processing and transport
MASLILDRLRANDPTFTKLKLVYAPTEIYDTLDDLLGALRVNHTVTYALLEGAFCRELSDTDFSVILKAVGKLKALQDLEIWSSPVPVAALCQAIKPAYHLTRVGLGMVTLSGDMTADSLKDHPSLRTFCLSDFSMAQDSSSTSNARTIRLDSLLRALATCPALETVEIFANRSARSTSSGVLWSPLSLAALLYATPHLTLRRLDLTVEAVRELTAHLKRQQRERQEQQREWSPRLRVLNLNENQLQDVGCVALVQALTEHAFPVKELNLRANEITAEGCRGLVEQLLSVPATVTVTDATINAANTADTATSTQTGALEKLNLACNELPDDSVPALVDLIGKHTSLKRLELYRTSLTDVGCTQLAEAVATNRVLLSLGLGKNQITDVSYISWAKALSVNETLESISLQVDHKKITEAGAQAMLDMMHGNYSLEHLGTSLSTSYDRLVVQRTRINMFLRLNHAGRRRLLQGSAPSRRDWLQTVEAVLDDLNAIRYLVQSNPTLWLSD